MITRVLSVKNKNGFIPFANVKDGTRFVPWIIEGRLSFYILFNNIESITYESDFPSKEISGFYNGIDSELLAYSTIYTNDYNSFETGSVDPSKTSAQGFLSNVDNQFYATLIIQTFNTSSFDLLNNVSGSQIEEILTSY